MRRKNPGQTAPKPERRRKPERKRLYRSKAYMDLLARIGANLRRLREARNWSQEECAFRCGDMAAPLLRRIELASSNITALTIARLCEGLDVDASELFLAGTPLKKRRPGRPSKSAKTVPESEKKAPRK